MRVIKGDYDTAMPIITGEMLNIEASILHFIDGKKTNTPLELYYGYPRIINNNIVDTITRSFGKIYVHKNHTHIDHTLELHILSMEKNIVSPDNKAIDPLQMYRNVIPNDKLVNIKIKPECAKTTVPDRSTYGTQYNVKRIISKYVANSGVFNWKIEPYGAELLTESYNNRSSIFWDINDVCKLPHNSVVSHLRYEDFCGGENIIDKSVRLFRYGDPLRLILSPCNYAQKLVNFTMLNIYKLIFDVKLFGEDYDGNCHKCKSVLWDDNYVIKFADDYRPICVMCAHGQHHREVLAAHKIYRTTFPISRREMINRCEDPVIREICNDVCENGLSFEKFAGVKISLLGKNFAAVKNMVDYLFVGDKSIFGERKILKYTMKK